MKYAAIIIGSFVLGYFYNSNNGRGKKHFYCAKIEYKNPLTGLDSEYHERVTVKNKKILRVYLPGGGWVEDFTEEHMVHRDTATIFDFDGRSYKIKLICEGDCLTEEGMESYENFPPEEDADPY